ncbi:MAG: SIS domain-containing protein [Burkholderiales bacterium]|jgi:arabinose-5-phosphate isomerase
MPYFPAFDGRRALRLARQTFDIEASALIGLKQSLDPGFSEVVHTILQCTGRIVVTGIGKSGHVGRKIAATLSSTGTASFFLHPAEAVHGDLGMLKAGDVVLAISNSGESDELLELLPALKRLQVILVAMTGHPQSTLGRHANWVLSCAVDQEACPLNLAPTASTTAQMAMGDALAVALLDARGFREEDFARSHPGGSLGRKLLTLVRDVMRTGNHVAHVSPDTSFIDMVREMSRKRLGATAITDKHQKVLGIFTDGDLRRLLETGQDLRLLTADDVMSTQPKIIQHEALAAEAASIMEHHRITTILVVDEESRLVGILNFSDLMASKVI